MKRRSLEAIVVCASMLWPGSGVLVGNTNGSAGDMPAYYDGQLFTINFKELPPTSEEVVQARNKSVNIIFMSDPGLPGGQPFISVLDAIQRDGFNPLWQEVQLLFNAGFTPRQLTSDTEIQAAMAAGQVTLFPTGELYRCSVVGKKSQAQ